MGMGACRSMVHINGPGFVAQHLRVTYSSLYLTSLAGFLLWLTKSPVPSNVPPSYRRFSTFTCHRGHLCVPLPLPCFIPLWCYLSSSFLSFLIELVSSVLLEQYSPVLLSVQTEWDLCQPSHWPWCVIYLFPTVHFSNKDDKIAKALIELLFLVRKREEIQLEAIFRPLALVICFLTHLKISVLSNRKQKFYLFIFQYPYSCRVYSITLRCVFCYRLCLS